jgi:glycosyltransferase involved in cell wall biosynthesis
MSIRPTIGFIGRVTPEKGVHLLLDAVGASTVLKGNCDVIVVGNHGFSASDPLTPYEFELRKKVATTGISANFIPFQNRTDIQNIFKLIDILVVPSVFPEPFGLVVLEANSYGIPVIHSTSGGLLEASGGQSLVFDSNSCTDLARKLNLIMADPTLWETLHQNALHWADLSSWEMRLTQFFQILSHTSNNKFHVTS